MFAFLLEFKCKIPYFWKGASTRGGGVCGAERVGGGLWQSPRGTRSSKFLLCLATRCIQLQPGSVVKGCRIASLAAKKSKRGPDLQQHCRAAGGHGSRGGRHTMDGGPWLSARVWTPRVDLLWRAKFSCRCMDALLSKTIARLLGNWHLPNKKAKNKRRGQRDGALSSAQSAYSHRRAFWLQLVRVNCTVRDVSFGLSVS